MDLLQRNFASVPKKPISIISLHVFQVYELEGVVQVHDVHVWTLCTGTYYGSLRVDVMAGADTRRTLAAARNILTQVTVKDQRERERERERGGGGGGGCVHYCDNRKGEPLKIDIITNPVNLR